MFVRRAILQRKTASVTSKSVMNSPEVQEYVIRYGRGADPLLEELGIATRAAMPEMAHMAIPLAQAALLSFLVRLVKARTVVEVGMFTGSSTIAMARALPEDGRLLTCEIDPRCRELSQPFFDRAGVSDRVEVRMGAALDTLRALPDTPHLDLAFIDADKPGYIGYWNELVPRLRPGGLLVVDNTLFSGEVVSPGPDSKAAAVHAFNEHALNDSRVEMVLLNTIDGITLARRI